MRRSAPQQGHQRSAHLDVQARHLRQERRSQAGGGPLQLEPLHLLALRTQRAAHAQLARSDSAVGRSEARGQRRERALRDVAVVERREDRVGKGRPGVRQVCEHLERGALAVPGRRQLELRAVVRSEYVPGDVEAEPRAAAPLQLAHAHLREHAAVAQRGQLARVEANAVVGHAHAQLTPPLARVVVRLHDAHAHVPALLRKLDRVRDAVGQDLREAREVAHKCSLGQGARQLLKGERDAIRQRLRRKDALRRVQQLAQLELAVHQDEAAGIDALKVWSE